MTHVTLNHEKTVLKCHIEATDREIDAPIFELYKLTEDQIRSVEEAT